MLTEWANQHGGLRGSLEDALEATLFAAVNSASRLYRLRDLGRDAFHDWGGLTCSCFYRRCRFKRGVAL